MYTMEALLDELQREMKMRVRVYPRLVSNGGLQAEVASKRIAMLQQIIEHFEMLAEQERLL